MIYITVMFIIPKRCQALIHVYEKDIHIHAVDFMLEVLRDKRDLESTRVFLLELSLERPPNANNEF